MSRSAEAPPVRMPTRMRFAPEVEEVTIRCAPRVTRREPRAAAGPAAPFRSPFAHELNFGNELDAELLAHFSLAALHELAHVVRRRIADIDDEVRVLRAHDRAALGRALQPGGFDQAAGMIARRVPEDRAGVRLRERLFRDPL